MTGVLYFFTHLLKGAKPEENWPLLGSSSVYGLVSMAVKTLVSVRKQPQIHSLGLASMATTTTTTIFFNCTAVTLHNLAFDNVSAPPVGER